MADFYSDVWQWDPATQFWTWVAGSKPASVITVDYGAKNVAAASNAPNSRYGHTAWFSPRTGAAYMFGGLGMCRLFAFTDGF